MLGISPDLVTRHLYLPTDPGGQLFGATHSSGIAAGGKPLKTHKYMKSENNIENTSGSDCPAASCPRCGQAECRECAHCGEMECDHHEFEAVQRPAGCGCAAGEWGDPTKIPAVCEEHQGDICQNCTRCEHDFGCHANA